MAVTFKGVVAKLLAAAKAVKADIIKAAEEAPIVVGDVTKVEAEAAPVIDLLFPGAAPIEEAAVEAFEVIADVVEAAGPAAGANGLSVTFDQALIAKVQAALPALKAFAAKL